MLNDARKSVIYFVVMYRLFNARRMFDNLFFVTHVTCFYYMLLVITTQAYFKKINTDVGVYFFLLRP
ncbi:MAG: hypothetical protein UT41_C0001G0002 [Candidatus Wolfebacteria bacterium GW2011_GWC2_39_22]|uniref:Uncharacterized protein n=2 Tax=Candidatus Wolfeibacteriota TaxID=1752735 RepID=A0A0G1H9E5_9BACT|nr:MAG: hypothetical protein UT41_C0001G0002 [Candidatus Wolfebacteria bacterium GW2011_GWC2_39_22]KKT43410.1 MAG: hypothetical protein UW32_C0001G0002 [Candidatus Wolfebacteria bacterium GW2011_GWE2_44_13]